LGGTQALDLYKELAQPRLLLSYAILDDLPVRDLVNRQLRFSSHSVDLLACPRCGNLMRLLATIEDPRVVEQLLTHLGLPSERVRADPAHPPPAILFADTPA
jgi:hypothetical protein